MRRLLCAALLVPWCAAPAPAQDCALRCITVEQFMGEERTAVIPLACDAPAMTCRGEGQLRIGGVAMPVVVSARYLVNAVEVGFRTPRPIGSMGETQSFVVPLSDERSQARNIALRWSHAGELPLVTRHLPGHITIRIARYQAPHPT